MTFNKNDIVNFFKTFGFSKIDFNHFGRDFGKNYIKFQFKLDHLNSSNRTAILGGALAVMLVPWFFLIYMPQVDRIAALQQQVTDLNSKTNLLVVQRNMILTLSKSNEIKSLVVKYNKLKTETDKINQNLLNYHNHYIDEKAISKMVYSTLLNDASDISVETFTTLAPEPKPTNASQPTKPAPNTPATATTAPNTPTESVFVEPEVTRYSLVLRGDYFSIMECLQRLEALKWDVFWDKLDYAVDHYPKAIAKIEFFTLKVADEHVAAVAAPFPDSAATPLPGGEK